MPKPPALIQHVLPVATNALQKGDLVVAEITLAPLFQGELPANSDLLNIGGALRIKHGRHNEAAGLIRQAKFDIEPEGGTTCCARVPFPRTTTR